jgi:myosin-5
MPKQFAQNACNQWLESDKFALGKTKVFFRTGQVALLEQKRHEILANAATMIQKTWRGFAQSRKFAQIKKSILIIQATCRAVLAYRRMKYLQMHRAVIVLQANVRGFLQRRRYQRIREAERQKARYEQSVITIQKFCRGYLIRKERVKYIRKVIIMQSCVRRWLAKRKFREMKAEARSVNHLQNLNQTMANRIVELRERLDSMVCLMHFIKLAFL